MTATLPRSLLRRALRSSRVWLQRQQLHTRLSPRLKACRTYKELSTLQASRDELYAFLDYYYCHSLAPAFKQHKRYFEQDMRGFGEKAFHAMWFLLFAQFRFGRALEIGVYRGQTVTLWSLLSRQLGHSCDVHALSPFTDTGDSVSHYAAMNYVKDIGKHCRHFNIGMPSLCRALSTTGEAERYISSRSWDLIYIDGNHDYDVARHDWDLSSRSVRDGGIVVLDDAALGTDYHPACFATAGHPGPSRVAAEVNASDFVELPSVGHNRVFQRRVK